MSFLKVDFTLGITARHVDTSPRSFLLRKLKTFSFRSFRNLCVWWDGRERKALYTFPGISWKNDFSFSFDSPSSSSSYIFPISFSHWWKSFSFYLFFSSRNGWNGKTKLFSSEPFVRAKAWLIYCSHSLALIPMWTNMLLIVFFWPLEKSV